MSLGTGALKVSGVPDAIAAERYPWQPWKVGTTQSKPSFRCLENGGSREQAKGDMVPPIPNLTPSTKNLKPRLTTDDDTYLEKLASPKQLTQGHNAMGTKDEW